MHARSADVSRDATAARQRVRRRSRALSNPGARSTRAGLLQRIRSVFVPWERLGRVRILRVHHAGAAAAMRSEALTAARVAIVALASACGGDIAVTVDASAIVPCGSPPAAPSVATSAVGGKRAYAIRRLYFGDTDRQGNKRADAWKDLGFDIDGKATPTGYEPGLCRNGSSVHVDGTCGIDNAFGAMLVPVLLTERGDGYLARANASIEAGGVTHLLVVVDIAGARDVSRVSGAMVVSTPLGRAPVVGRKRRMAHRRTIARRRVDRLGEPRARWLRHRPHLGRPRRRQRRHDCTLHRHRRSRAPSRRPRRHRRAHLR